MDCSQLEFSDSSRMEIGVDVRQCKARVVVFSRKHKNLTNWHGIRGSDWIIRLVNISTVFFKISGIGLSLGLANDGTLVLISTCHRLFMLYKVDALGIHQI